MSDETRLQFNSAGRPFAETRFRVRYHETDAMGIVHHAAYITWFEEGRSAFTRALGYSYAQMAADGMDLAVVDVSARYHQPARYDDEVVVSTCLQEMRSRDMTFSYEVRRAADGVLLVTGSSRHISVDRAGRAIRILDGVRRRLAELG